MNPPPPARSRPPPPLDSPRMERRKGIPFVRLWRRSAGVLVSGVREDPDFRALALLVAGLMGSGTVFYMLVVGWNFVDAIYFCTIVLTTVGLGDVSPTTDAAKIFTVFYALTGIGVLVAFGTAFAQRLVKQSAAEAASRRR
jgi:voltage-gated potassium channel